MSLAHLVVIAALTSAPAAEPDPSAAVARLGSADPAERAAASAALETLGRAALPALRQARESPDRDLRDRAAALWESIERGLMTRPTRVRFDYEGLPLADVIDDLKRQTGFPLRVSQPRSQGPVNVREPEPVPFWEAVECLGLKGARFANHNPHGVGFPDLDLTPDPEFAFTSISGPFRVALTGLHLHRDRRLIGGPWVVIDGFGQRIGVPREGPGKAVGSEVVTFSGGLDLVVEPRVWFTQEAPARLTEASDDLGQSLVPGPAGADDVGDFAFHAGSGVTRGDAEFRLRLPDRPGRVARLRGVVPVMLHLRRPDPTLVVPLAGAAGKTFRCDEAEFAVHSVDESPTATTVKMTVTLDVARADLPEHPGHGVITSRLLLLGAHQLELADAAGTVLVDSAGGGGGGGKTPHVYQWTIATYGKGGATHLRYFGMIHARTDAAFDFRDVPLP